MQKIQLSNHFTHKKLFRFCLPSVAMMIFTFLSGTLAGIFVGYDTELLDMTVYALKIFAVAFIFAGCNIFTSAFFTALNNGGVSAAISFMRTLVFQMLSVLILPAFFGLDGIWWAVAVAETAAFIVSLTFLFAKRKKYHYI